METENNVKTLKKMQVFNYIRRYLFQHDCAPTQYEIAKGLGIPRSTTYHYIQHLVKEGLIVVNAGVKRGIKMVDPGHYMQVPIIGLISAGEPINTLEKEEVLNLAELMLGSDRYVLQVRGDSMVGDNICDGDYIICQRGTEIEDGQIAVVLVDEKNVMLKRIKLQEDGNVVLLSSNPSIEPKQYPFEKIKIKGVYLGLIRLPAYDEIEAKMVN